MMDEFTKLKITFSLALLGVLFTISPLLKIFGDIGYELFGLNIQAKFIYYIFASLLGLTVYLYGVELISEKPFFGLKKIANYTYALAIIIIPLYIFIFLIIQFSKLLGVLFKSDTIIEVSKYGLSVISGLISGLLTRFLSGKLAKKDKSSTYEKYTKEESSRINKINDLYNNKHFDLVVLECFKSIEISIRKILTYENIKFKPSMVDMISKVKKLNLLPQDLMSQLNEIRNIRNKVAHTEYNLTEVEATNIVKYTTEIISFLEGEEIYSSTEISGIKFESWIGNKDSILKRAFALSTFDHVIKITNNSIPKTLNVKIDININGQGINFVLENDISEKLTIPSSKKKDDAYLIFTNLIETDNRFVPRRNNIVTRFIIDNPDFPVRDELIVELVL